MGKMIPAKWEDMWEDVMIRFLHNFNIFTGNKQLEDRELVLEPPFSAWSFELARDVERPIFGIVSGFFSTSYKIVIVVELP